MHSLKTNNPENPTIYFLPDELKVGLVPAETILEASLRLGISHAHACGGKARCSTCRVVILEGLENCMPRNSREESLAKKLHFDPQVRLACQTRIAGNIKLRRPVVDTVDMELTSLIGHKSVLEYVGTEKKIAMLFSDIWDFTPFVEELPPYDVVHILNRYFHLMGSVVEKHKGWISDYVGDGMLALFGIENAAPAALQAVRAGIEMFDAVEKLKPYLKSMYDRNFNIRIGIHFGEVVVGTVGAGGQNKIAVFGDGVNMASRVEAANKLTGTNFLITEETWQAVSGQVIVKNEFELPLKGKTGKYRLFEVTGLK